MKFSVDVQKVILCTIYSSAFLKFRWRCWYLLLRLSLVAQFINDANLMCISFSVKHPQTFRESWISLANMSRPNYNFYTYPFNPQLVMKTWVESHDKNPKDQRNVCMWTIIGVFQFWVDCFSIGKQALI